MSYKYNPIPEGIDVIFLEVVKTPHWLNKLNETRYCDIPVGAITWIKNNDFNFKIIDGIPFLTSGENLRYAITPENNRHYVNFDPSCFKILHTSKQKIER